MTNEPVGEDKIDLSHLEELLSGRKISPKLNKVLRFLILPLWAGLLFLVIYQGWTNWDKLIPILSDAEYSRIIPAIIYYLLSLIAAIAGWLLIIRTFDHSPGWWKNIKIYSVTLAARRLPGTFWYVGGRILMYQRIGVRKTSIILASVIELTSSFITAGAIGVGFFSLIGNEISDTLQVVISLIIFCGLILIHPNVIRLLLRRIGLYHSLKASTFDWFLWLLSFSVMWIMSGMMVVQLVNIVTPMELKDLSFVIGAWSLSGMVGFLTILLPSSFGVTEISLMAFLTKLLPLTLAGSIALATRLFTLLMEVLLAAAFYPDAIRYSREHITDQENEDRKIPNAVKDSSALEE
jgi:uncharacterized membrane protein YbhN (UPF0104 family)